MQRHRHKPEWAKKVGLLLAYDTFFWRTIHKLCDIFLHNLAAAPTTEVVGNFFCVGIMFFYSQLICLFEELFFAELTVLHLIPLYYSYNTQQHQ